LQIPILGLAEGDGVADVGIGGVGLADLRIQTDGLGQTGRVIGWIHNFRTGRQLRQRIIQFDVVDLSRLLAAVMAAMFVLITICLNSFLESPLAGSLGTTSLSRGGFRFGHPPLFPGWPFWPPTAIVLRQSSYRLGSGKL
jgi:hypothetical protein